MDQSPCRLCPERTPRVIQWKYDNDHRACQIRCELLDAWQRTTHPSYRPAINTADEQGYSILL